jgi:phytoene dehydrogenase-like protein
MSSVTTERFDVVVIGAGHNGLVCAAYLARAGLKVVCVESRDRVGGMSSPRTLGNVYHFPGLAHAAFAICPQIRRDLKLDRFGYSVGRGTDTVALNHDGRHLIIGAEAPSGDGLPDGDRRAYSQFRSEYLAFAKALRPLFENKPPRLKGMMFEDKRTLARLGWNIRMRLGRESMYEFLRVVAINIYDVLDEAFEDDRLKGALAAQAVLGNAMGPRTPGSVLTWLQRLYGELNGPLSVQRGCPLQLVHALTRSAEGTGVSIRVNARVEKILTKGGKAVGVRLSNGETLNAEVIISNVDPRATFLNLVGAPQLDAMFANRVMQIRGTGTVAKLHLALAGKPEFRGLEESLLDARLLVAPSMKYVEDAFNHSKYGEYSERPVLEITIPSLHDDALAPDGHHVMSVNVAYAPYNLQGGWESRKITYANRVISYLENYAPGLQSLIVDYELRTPWDIEEQYGAVLGHWHHGELTMHQSFMMRPLYGASQYDTPIEKLFLCGAGCHPGGGITGLPGRSAAKRVLELGGTP